MSLWDNPTGGASSLRIAAAIVAFIIAGGFFYASWWFDKNIAVIMNLPFVFGALIAGLFGVGLGIQALIGR